MGFVAAWVGVGNVDVTVEVCLRIVNLSSMEGKFFLTISFRVCTSCKMSFSGKWSRSRTRVSLIASRCLSRTSTGGLLSFLSLASMTLIIGWFVCNERIRCS